MLGNLSVTNIYRQLYTCCTNGKEWRREERGRRDDSLRGSFMRDKTELEIYERNVIRNAYTEQHQIIFYKPASQSTLLYGHYGGVIRLRSSFLLLLFSLPLYLFSSFSGVEALPWNESWEILIKFSRYFRAGKCSHYLLLLHDQKGMKPFSIRGSRFDN